MNDISNRLLKMVERYEALNTRLKTAENITHQLSGASVNELRYMGRNLSAIIYIQGLSNKDQKICIDGEERDIESYLNDAELCLKRADHDLIDSVYGYVALDIHQKNKQYGEALLCAHFGSENYLEILKMIRYVQDQVEKSRGAPERIENRSQIYEKLYADGYFDKLIDIYKKYEEATPLFQAQYAEISRASRNAKFAIIIGVIASIATLSNFFGYDFNDIYTAIVNYKLTFQSNKT